MATDQMIPNELVQDIAGRMDAVTIVRMTAANKMFRMSILEPPFLRCLLRSYSEKAGRWFDPTLPRVVSFLVDDGVTGQDVLGSSSMSIDRELPKEFEALFSRYGFLLLQSLYSDEDRCTDLCVCDILTGQITHLPPVSLNPRTSWHTPAFLPVEQVKAGRCFKLLIANRRMEFQVFSSKTGEWSAVRAAPERERWCEFSKLAQPAVVGDIVYWSCVGVKARAQLICLDFEAGMDTTLPLPLRDRDTGTEEYHVAAVGGGLSVIVVGSLDICMFTWTSTPTSGPAWTKTLALNRPQIQTWCAGMEIDAMRTVFPIPIGGFGQATGALVLRQVNGDLVMIDVGTKEATLLTAGTARLDEIILHDIDLASILQVQSDEIF